MAITFFYVKLELEVTTPPLAGPELPEVQEGPGLEKTEPTITITTATPFGPENPEVQDEEGGETTYSETTCEPQAVETFRVSNEVMFTNYKCTSHLKCFSMNSFQMKLLCSL